MSSTKVSTEVQLRNELYPHRLELILNSENTVTLRISTFLTNSFGETADKALVNAGQSVTGAQANEINKAFAQDKYIVTTLTPYPYLNVTVIGNVEAGICSLTGDTAERVVDQFFRQNPEYSPEFEKPFDMLIKMLRVAETTVA